jgi:hypothetical protein
VSRRASPIRDSRGEVERLIDTFRIASEEATRMVGEVLPLDITPRARGYRSMWKRVPIGVCSFITPFNFPLNLVRAQSGAGDRGRLSVRLETGECDADRRADRRRSSGGDVATQGRVSRFYR